MSIPCPTCGKLRPTRLTATPFDITVWVQEPFVDARPPEHEVWLRPNQMRRNDDAVDSGGWVRLSRHEWFELRDIIDKYLVAPSRESS